MADTAGGLESSARARGVERVKFPCFDGFRALAAISVLVTHVAYLSGFDIHSRFGAFTARMDVGVAVFFMISGFLLYRPFVASRLAGSHGPRPASYFWRRALRILPAYWVALTITVFVLHVLKELPSAENLFLFYGLVIARAAATPQPQAQMRRELVILTGLVAAGVVYRAAVTAADFDATRTAQLQNVLPGWIDVFAIGMVLAVASAWITQRRTAAPAGLDRRWAPPRSWRSPSGSASRPAAK